MAYTLKFDELWFATIAFRLEIYSLSIVDIATIRGRASIVASTPPLSFHICYKSPRHRSFAAHFDESAWSAHVPLHST